MHKYRRGTFGYSSVPNLMLSIERLLIVVKGFLLWAGYGWKSRSEFELCITIINRIKEKIKLRKVPKHRTSKSLFSYNLNKIKFLLLNQTSEKWFCIIWKDSKSEHYLRDLKKINCEYLNHFQLWYPQSFISTRN